MKLPASIASLAVCLAVLAAPAALAQNENDPGSDGLQSEGGFPPPGPGGEVDELPAEEGTASEVDYQTFHDALNPYGNWVYTDEYGWVWMPAGVDQDWRPYSDGQWLWTSYGWTWSGNEAWAWAPYHYGRWCYLNNGWCWVPGYVWGPAWVAWRTGGDSVGWVALYPGYPYGGPWLGTYPIYYNQWCFTGYGNFWGGPVYGHLYPTPYVQSSVWAQTHPVVPVQGNGAVTYHGPSHSVVAAAVGHPITPVAIHPVASAHQAGFRASANAMNVYAPRFQAAAHPFALHQGGMAPSVSGLQPRGVGSLVRQGQLPPTVGANRMARAPLAPSQGVAHPAKPGVPPHPGTVPTSNSHGASGGGSGRPPGHPAPQA